MNHKLKMKAEDLKIIVQEKYSEIAKNNTGCGCGIGCCDSDFTVFSEDYSKIKGYNKDADLQLGCGVPVEYAQLKEGNKVLDLGSGAGNDCFVALEIVGKTGHVTGLDFTDEMLVKANANKEKLGITNLEFVKGDIEAMPLDANSYDVVISNCVLNLVPNKEKAFAEMYRVLQMGGHFCVSDIVLEGELPDKLREAATLYAGCVSGAIQLDEYLNIARTAGFKQVEIKRKSNHNLPDDLLLKYIAQEEIDDYRNSGNGIFSVTVVGIKL